MLREYGDRDDEQAEVAPERPDTRELGERGEALAADFLTKVKGHELLTQHTPGDKPQGIDLETLRPDGVVQFTEVKATDGHAVRPRMAQTADGRQQSDAWLQHRAGDSSQVAFEAPAEGQVAKQALLFDAKGDTLTLWKVGPDGAVGRHPTEIYTASDFDEDA